MISRIRAGEIYESDIRIRSVGGPVSMQNAQMVRHDEFQQLFDLVADFDAGKITRSEFQRRARVLPNESLLVLSRILAGDVTSAWALADGSRNA